MPKKIVRHWVKVAAYSLITLTNGTDDRSWIRHRDSPADHDEDNLSGLALMVIQKNIKLLLFL